MAPLALNYLVGREAVKGVRSLYKPSSEVHDFLAGPPPAPAPEKTPEEIAAEEARLKAEKEQQNYTALGKYFGVGWEDAKAGRANRYGNKASNILGGRGSTAGYSIEGGTSRANSYARPGTPFRL